MHRASVDLPDPEGPNTTVTEAGCTCRLTPFKIGSLRSGTTATTSRSVNAPVGGTRVSAGSRSGFSRSSASRRANAPLASDIPRQAPTSKSIGASARVISMLAAIIAPGDNSPCTTSNAPAPRASDCCV